MSSQEREVLLVLGSPGPDHLSRLRAVADDLELVVGETTEQIADAAPRAAIVLCFWGARDLLREVLAVATRLRWIHIMSAGINHLTSPELLQSPATITNGKGVFSASLGEWVLGAILYFAKDFRRLIKAQSEGLWEPFDVVEVAGQTVGILGYGDIGKAVAVRVHPLGMRVVGLTRSGSGTGPAGRPAVDDPAEQILGPHDRIQLIEQSDYVILTAPLTPDTRGMVGEAELAVMKPDSVLVNIGRGPLVDEEALIRALSEGKIKGAALDVFHREPLPPDHPLYRLDNVLLSPHSADRTPDFIEKALQLFVDNLGRYRRGEELVNVIDKSAGY